MLLTHTHDVESSDESCASLPSVTPSPTKNQVRRAYRTKKQQNASLKNELVKTKKKLKTYKKKLQERQFRALEDSSSD